MTRDEYIEANWRRISERQPDADWRARAGDEWDRLAAHAERGTGPMRSFWYWAIGRCGPGMVCRACSGWGEVFEWGRQDEGWPGSDATGLPRMAADRYVEVIVDRAGLCPCDGPKRAHTVQLHRIVETIAAMRSPMVDDWPEQWLIDIDWREAAGDRSPMAVWWAQFWAWARGGTVDEPALADALEQLVAARRSSVRVAGGDALADLGLDIRVDGEKSVEVTLTHDGGVTTWREDDLGARLLADRDSSPPSAGTAADVLAAVRRRLAAERIPVSGLCLETGVGQVHISYDLDRMGNGPEALRAVLAAAREAAPAGVYVTAGARRGQARDRGFAVGERGPTNTPVEINGPDDWQRLFGDP